MNGVELGCLDTRVYPQRQVAGTSCGVSTMQVGSVAYPCKTRGGDGLGEITGQCNE